VVGGIVKVPDDKKLQIYNKYDTCIKSRSLRGLLKTKEITSNPE
jgi:hypothetical protein